jgi:membrane protein implicated in regulation of membrane protease activity
MFLLLALVLFIFLPSPWNAFAGFACIVLFILEAAFWQRRVRGQKTQTGVERLVGATGEVSERLAHSAAELPPGSRVRVIAVDGLVLEVEAVDDDSMNGRPP